MVKMSLQDSVVGECCQNVVDNDNLLHKRGYVDSLSQTTVNKLNFSKTARG